MVRMIIRKAAWPARLMRPTGAIFGRTTKPLPRCQSFLTQSGGFIMHSIIYIIGLIVVVMAVLSFFGLR
jgi:hypothetical protein